jgi:hypothetical protein
VDINLALVALIVWVALTLAAGAYLEGRQHASRAVTVIRPTYRSNRHYRPRW